MKKQGDFGLPFLAVADLTYVRSCGIYRAISASGAFIGSVVGSAYCKFLVPAEEECNAPDC